MPNELTKVNDQEQAAVLFGGEKLSAEYTSIPNDGTREAAAAIFNSFGDAESLGDNVGQVIEVEHVSAHTVEIESEENGVVTAVRCILISPDGTRYAAVSTGVMDSVKKLFAAVGLPPWTPPVKIAAKNVKTRKGFKTLRLELKG